MDLIFVNCPQAAICLSDLVQLGFNFRA
jgi:hypothetical protein